MSDRARYQIVGLSRCHCYRGNFSYFSHIPSIEASDDDLSWFGNKMMKLCNSSSSNYFSQQFSHRLYRREPPGWILRGKVWTQEDNTGLLYSWSSGLDHHRLLPTSGNSRPRPGSLRNCWRLQ